MPRIAVADFQGPLDSMRHAITSAFTTDLALSDRVRLVERAQMDQAMAELRLSLTDTVDASTAPRLGMIVAADKVVVGQYSMMGGIVHISARLVDVETGTVEGGQGAVVEGDISGALGDVYGLVHQLANRFHWQLTGDWLPAVVLEQIGDSTVLSRLERIDPTLALQQDGGEIGVTLSLDRGNRASYHMGETLQLAVEVDRECYVYVYNVDIRQQVSLVFPNAFDRENLMQPGQRHVIPSEDVPWELAAVGEPGQEKMVAIASVVPLEHTGAATGDIETCLPSATAWIEKAVLPQLKAQDGNTWGVAVVDFFTLPEAAEQSDTIN